MNVHKVGSVVGDAMIQVGKSLLALVHFTYLQNIFQVKKNPSQSLPSISTQTFITGMLLRYSYTHTSPPKRDPFDLTSSSTTAV